MFENPEEGSLIVSNEQPYVQFKNVQKSYDGIMLVVKDFNLDVAE
ncbi:MAG: putative spermidine/putrescine transport system ATP-binding protein, partial [Polaribacter sp.]